MSVSEGDRAGPSSSPSTPPPPPAAAQAPSPSGSNSGVTSQTSPTRPGWVSSAQAADVGSGASSPVPHTSSPTPAGSGSFPTPPIARRRPRPTRCYSLEALREEPAYTAPARGSVLAPLNETSHTMDVSDGAAVMSPVDTVLPTLTASPVPAQPASNVYPTALDPETALFPDPIPTGSSTPQSAPGFRSGTNTGTSNTLFQPIQPTRTRGRSHTVSVTMPSSQARRVPDAGERERRRARLDSLRDSLDQEGHEDGGSSINVRMSLDDRSGPGHRTRRRANTDVMDRNGELHDDAVGVLDCVDPEVSTLNHLQNVTNSIMFPNIPQLWSRKPTLVLAATPSEHSLEDNVAGDGEDENVLPPPATTPQKRGRATTLTRMFAKSTATPPRRSSLTSQVHERPGSYRPMSPSSDPGVDVKMRADHKSPASEFLPPQEIPERLDDKLYDGYSSDSSSDAGEHDLDKHLRKVLQRQERKAKLKAQLKGLWAYLKTPMGIITAIYGIAVVFWGAAIVFFLFKWIPVSSKEQNDIWIEISSQVVNGLFTVTGVGLIPWRAMDTYRMGVIWTLRRRFERRCKKRGLPPLDDPDDIRDPENIPEYGDMLNPEEWKKLRFQQDKFSKSQTWYRPHATATHRAFPMKLALWNTILMDGNSAFQCMLCGCMWGMNRHKRPAWTTGTLIPLSFLCGIGAGALIWHGGRLTKKTEVVEAKLRKALAVDEPVPETVKKPRRATVSGESPHIATTLLPSSLSARPPQRAATTELPQFSGGEYRLDRDAILGSVAEGDESAYTDRLAQRRSDGSVNRRDVGGADQEHGSELPSDGNKEQR